MILQVGHLTRAHLDGPCGPLSSPVVSWGWLVVGWGHLSLITGQASLACSVGGHRVPKNSKREQAPMFWLFLSLLKMTKSRVIGRGFPQMEDPGRCKVIVTLPVTTHHGQCPRGNHVKSLPAAHGPPGPSPTRPTVQMQGWVSGFHLSQDSVAQPAGVINILTLLPNNFTR